MQLASLIRLHYADVELVTQFCWIDSIRGVKRCRFFSSSNATRVKFRKKMNREEHWPRTSSLFLSVSLASSVGLFRLRQAKSNDKVQIVNWRWQCLILSACANLWIKIQVVNVEIANDSILEKWAWSPIGRRENRKFTSCIHATLSHSNTVVCVSRAHRSRLKQNDKLRLRCRFFFFFAFHRRVWIEFKRLATSQRN